MKPTPKMRVVARYKTALCRRVTDSRRFVISCEWSGITLGKGSSPLSAWTDAASLLPKALTRSRRDRASLAQLTLCKRKP